jgi:hypothetical protein
MFFTITLTLYLVSIAFPWIVALPIWLWLKRRELGSMWNLHFRRSRTVEARLHTLSGRVIPQFVIPNSKNWVLLRSAKSKGWYKLEPQFQEWNYKYAVPVYDVLETQIIPEPPGIGLSDEKTPEVEVEVAQADGTTKRERRQLPPTVHLTWRQKVPKLLKLGREAGSVTAEEVHNLMVSKIVERMAIAQAEMIKQIRIIFIVSLISLGISVIGAFVAWAYLHDIDSKLNAVIALAARSATSGGH